MTINRDIEWKEKQYGTSESSRVDAILRARELRRNGFTAHVKFGNKGQYVLVWRKRPRKKSK